MESSAGGKTKSQAIIISGESGSGKTEATKFIMNYLTRIATAQTRRGDGFFEADEGHLGQLEQKVLNSNPVLEAFGNARTLRNDNSSRFGKFIKIHFSAAGRIEGASIEKYLLEKTRLVRQIEGERNFHIFYQLLKGANEPFLSSLSLDRVIDAYSYLSCSSQSSCIPNLSDADEWSRTAQCLHTIVDDVSVENDVFQLLASILHLGNISFSTSDAEESAGGVTEQSRASLTIVAQLMSLEPGDIVTSLTRQNMYVNNNVIVKAQTVDQAHEKKNSLAKSVYSFLFSWLVDKINQSIHPPDKANNAGFIGLLDIYGFENFENLNSFEQLLINYANEKLQSHFNKHIFTIEQAEYELEGIDWSYVTFYDNLACVELIDGKPAGKAGIFQALDDSSSNIRQDSNVAFLTTINLSWSGSSGSQRHANYLCPRFNSDQKFGVLHYAGEVFYEIVGFVEKNREAMNNDLKDLLSRTANPLLKCIWNEYINSEAISSSTSTSNNSAALNAPKPGRKPSASSSSSVVPRGSFISKLKEDSVSKQFTSSLKQLFENLEATDPHFVRCVKPNSLKKSQLFNGKETLIQLKYSGMLEAIRIRQQGYALRIDHKEFFHKFSCLHPTSHTLQELVRHLSLLLSVSDESWQVGASKIFLKRDMSYRLEKLLWLRWNVSTRLLQKLFRKSIMKKRIKFVQAQLMGFAARRRFLRFKAAVIKLQAAYRRCQARRLFLDVVRSVVLVQTVARGRIARLLARKKRNPYNRMDYDSLTACLVTKNQELSLWFQEKMFDKCATLEQSISDIQTARSKMGLPERQPSSRDELDLFLGEVGFALEAVKGKDDKLVAPLYQYMARLESMKILYPTVQELQSTLLSAQEDLAKAVTGRHFKACSDLQAKIASVEVQIKNLGESQALMQLSMSDLKTRKAELDKQLTDSLSSKNFEKCSTIQVELDSLDVMIAQKDLSQEQVREKLAALQEAMGYSAKLDDFLSMARIKREIDILQAMLRNFSSDHPDSYASSGNGGDATTELASAVVKKSRRELLRLIAQKENDINSALAEKRYHLCENLNAELLSLQTDLSNIPTKSSIKRQIAEAQSELRNAISARQFSSCAKLEENIQVLERVFNDAESDEETLTVDDKENKREKNSKPRVASVEKVAKSPKLELNPTMQKSSSVEKSNSLKERDRPVSKLRPKAPITAADGSSILDVATKMAASRVDAALLLDV
ncbi:hypothetical protein EON64_04790, partial [archaeon]